MKIVHLSDTHGKHHDLDGKLPKGDIIIHSGDFTFAGSEEEAFDFINWFCDLPYLYKIFIAGNHDDCLDGADGLEGLPDDVHYLNNSGIEIDGLKIYGMPMFMSDAMSGQDLINISEIPEDIDILITHQPPYGILDFADNFHYGSQALLEKVLRIKPKLHLFGHIHDDNGVEKGNDTTYANSAVVDARYNMAFKVNTFEI